MDLAWKRSALDLRFEEWKERCNTPASKGMRTTWTQCCPCPTNTPSPSTSEVSCSCQKGLRRQTPAWGRFQSRYIQFILECFQNFSLLDLKHREFLPQTLNSVRAHVMPEVLSGPGGCSRDQWCPLPKAPPNSHLLLQTGEAGLVGLSISTPPGSGNPKGHTWGVPA